MKNRGFCLLAFLLFLLPPLSAATGVDFTSQSRTYCLMREKANSITSMPLYFSPPAPKLSFAQLCFGRISKRLTHSQTFEE